MNTSNLAKLPNCSKLFDFFDYLFSILHDKTVISELQDGKQVNKIMQKRAISNLTSYDSLAKKIGVTRGGKTYAEQLRDANPDFESLFEFKELHHKIVQSIFVVGDIKKIPHSKHEALKSIYVELFYSLDYFERELNKLNTFYVFQPKEDSVSILDEIVEKFFVPQISVVLFYIKDQSPDLFNNENNDYLVVKQFNDVIKLILSCKFNITKAFKKAIILFIKKELALAQATTHFSNEFRNINDNDFPSILRFENWINTIIVQNENTDAKLFNKIIAQHRLFHLFIKVKKGMNKNLITYKFKDLILDFYYYVNPKILELREKIDSKIVGGYYNRFIYSSYHQHSNFFDRKIDFFQQHYQYCITNAQTENLQREQSTFILDKKIHYNFNFLYTDKLPNCLIEYLAFGLRTFASSTNTEEIIRELKRHLNFSQGFKIIYLFAEAIAQLINNNLEVAKEKIREAYHRIDEYPIGTMFYRYILTFYIGICKVTKTTPYEFMKKINHLNNHSRFSLISLTMQKEYNILNRETLPSATYVEDVILIRSMAEFNQFCLVHKLNKNLFFNPFMQIEHCFSIMLGLMNNPFFKRNIHSIADVVANLNTPHYKEYYKYIKYTDQVNINPTVDFTQDGIKDLYRYQTFYLSVIKELKLEGELGHILEMFHLRLPLT